MNQQKTRVIASLLLWTLVQGPSLPSPRAKEDPKHFELQILPAPCPPGLSYCFFPSSNESGLVTLGNNSGSPAFTLLRLLWVGGKAEWKQSLLGPLPQTFTDKKVRLGRIPFLGETPSFGLAWATPKGTPRFFNRAPFLQTSVIEKAPPLGVPILSTDLDRDGLPELWALNPDQENEDAPPAILYSAPLTEEPSRSPIPNLGIGGGFAGVLAFDFDQDYLEDFLLFGPGKPATLVLNHGNMNWTVPESDNQPQGKIGSRLQAKQLFLSPSMREKQWLLAISQEDQALLLMRDGVAPFKPLLRDLGALAQGIRDARFLDQDLDGEIELWMLTDKGLVRASLQSQEIHLVQRIKGGRRLLIGDMDGDLAPDFCVLRDQKKAILLRSKTRSERLKRSMTISLEGIEEFPHAMGAYVELLVGEKVIQRHRWPPLRNDDALTLFFSLPSPLLETPSFRVTWPDGNVSESEAKPGTHSRLKH